MNNVLEINKIILTMLEALSFELIGSVAYDEDFSDVLREEIAETICDSEETYSHPEYIWD